MTTGRFFGVAWRGVYALISLVTGGLVAGAVMLVACLPGGLGGLFIGLGALTIWPIGMVCVGGPVWAVLHLLGRRRMMDARIVGSVGGGVSVLLMAVALFGPEDQIWPIVALAAAGVVSGFVGGSVVWTMAYGGRDGARA